MGTAAPGSATKTPTAPLTGTRLGRYTVGARLGVGGAASVYLGQLRGPHDFERVLALKVFHEHLLENEEFVSMFIDEANLAVRLNHPNVVHSYELGREEGGLFLAMEYLDGRPLSALIERAGDIGRTIPHSLAAWIGAQAARGLEYLHDVADDEGVPLGLIHRDISPHNVFLTYDGHVKLIDFGIARARGRITETGLGKIKGKIQYMAPEQLASQHIDARVDLYALGVTLYEATTGHRPFDADDETEAVALRMSEDAPDPRASDPDYPEALRRILTRALEREPDARYTSAREMAEDLEAFVATAAANASASLRSLLVELFEDDRRSRASAIELLRADRGGHIESGTFPGATRQPPEPPPRRGPLGWTIAGTLVGVGLLGAYAFSSKAPTTVAVVAPRATETAAPPGMATAMATAITIDVRLQPDVAARVTIDGRVLKTHPVRVSMERGDDPVEIVAEADGYERVTLSAVPDKDQFIVIPLSATPKPAASAESTPRPSPPRAPAVATPGSTHPKPQRPGPLVTDYPF